MLRKKKITTAVRPNRIKFVKIYLDDEGYMDIELISTRREIIKIMEEDSVIRRLKEKGVVCIVLPQADGAMRKYDN